MEKMQRFSWHLHALNKRRSGLLRSVFNWLILLIFSTALFVGKAHSAIAMVGIPEVVFPKDLVVPCLGDTTPDYTGWAQCIMHCDCGSIVSYEDEVENYNCNSEFVIYRHWTVADTCGLMETAVQEIEVLCLENIGSAKKVVNIDPGSSGVRGYFNATFEVVIENTGNARLTDLILEDPVANGYGSAFLGLVPGGEPRIIQSTASVNPELNMGYDGDGDDAIFTGNTGVLMAGQRIVVQYTIEVNPNAPGRPDTAKNQALVGGVDPCSDLVTDLSDTGSDPKGYNPGVLGDMGTADDPTVLPLVCVGTGAKAMACNKHTNISLDINCSLDIPASVILEGEDWGCDIFHEVMITDHYGKVIPSPIPGHFKGETLYVKVLDAVFGNSCWGTVLIEDKFRPIIECENDTIYCNYLDSLPDPVFYDNCDPNPTLRLLRTEAEVLTCDSNFTKRLVRHWQAEDEYGNKTNCAQTIMLKRIRLDSIKYPQDFTVGNNWALQCNGNYPLDSAGHPSPEYTGAPSIGGVPLYPFYQYCNVSTDYKDRVIQHDPCVKKIMRIWTIVEWHCGGAGVREVPQIIHIIDDEPPLISCPTIDYVTTNGGYDCEADVWLPPAIVSDNCTNVKVDVIYPGGILNGNGGHITLPFGIHQVRYVAHDECHNRSECMVEVEVADHTPPVTVCDGFTTIGLNEYGEAHLYAITLDDGTYDDCYLDSFAVRRMDFGAPCGFQDTTWKPYVRFCCDDVDSSNVMVVFRAWDKAGNYNDCMVEVEVQDKVAPSIYCPPNITISCEFHFEMDSLEKYFGTIVQDYADRQPIVVDDPYFQADGPLYDGHVLENCEVQIEHMVIDSLSQCRTGFLLRGFTVTDRHGLQTQCYQRITIIDYDPFDESDITWPLDYETDQCGAEFHPDSLPFLYGRPDIDDDKCSLVGVEWEDHIFSFVQDPRVCFKILRKWKIIDWCNFRMVNNQYVYESWEHEQIIKVNNSIGPVFNGDCEEITVCTYDPDCLDGRVELHQSASDDCTPSAELVWEYKIDLNRDGSIEDFGGGIGSSIDATDDFPIGKHYVIWSVEDLCGNKTVCRQAFEVVNCKPPTAYCKNGLVVDLMPIDTNGDGTVDIGRIDIWASDLDDNSGHACGNDVTLSFSPDTTDRFRTYDCDSLGMRGVRIYVTDRTTGLTDYCETFVEIQDNSGACPMNSGMISGGLNTEMAEAIKDVTVSVTGSVNYSGSYNGAFNFNNIPLNGNYLVTPSRNDNHLSGITTKDIVMIQRHLLGLEDLDSPYKIIAADANGDNDLSISDVVDIRRLLLGYFNELPDMTSWRFVDADFVFSDPQYPFEDQFNEDYAIFDMPGNTFSVNFIGMKVGDVDNSVDPQGISGLSTREEITEVWRTEYRDNTILFYANNDVVLSGAQFTLNFDPRKAQLVDVSGTSIELEDYHVGLNDSQDGIIRVAYDGEGTVIQEGDELFRLIFDVNVEEGLVSMVNYPLASEMYTSDLQVRSIRLTETVAEYTVLQNEPNPFDEGTIIGVEVSVPMTVEFKVFDVNGRTFVNREEQLSPGLNFFKVHRAELANPGVYYYQVSGDAGVVSKKMILVR